MVSNTPLLGTGGIIFMSLYFLSLIVIGLLGRAARKDDSMSDFYLAGRRMSLFILFLTLYATQYSGVTMIGYAGKAYRDGYRFLVSVSFMMAVIGAYLLYAPKLYRLSRKKKFITTGDYFTHRYDNAPLKLITSLIFIFALGSYILTNLKAVGYIVESSTGGVIPFSWGVIAMSLIMVIYETLGGMRSVAWTDAIQGVLLLLGCIFIFTVVEYQYGGLWLVSTKIKEMHPEFWKPPDLEQKRLWLSTLMIVFCGIPLYPHAIQRIYSAKDEKTLARSFIIMVFMPLFTTLFMVIIGIVGAAQFPGLDRGESERVVLILLSDISNHIAGIGMLLVLFLCAAVAAIMSTVDSALLSISSFFTQDIYRPIRPNSHQAQLTRMGKIVSWLVMGLMTYLAMVLPQTIWRLVEIKLDLLSQAAPALFLGLHCKKLKSGAVLAGLVAGICITVLIMTAHLIGNIFPAKPWGFHAGVWGLFVNFTTIGAVTIFQRKEKVDTSLTFRILL
ncbi:MAG: sodium:solute symporter family protein [Candidatus Scalindua sp. AMX11]|nr:MAG: sodium:solute symporter family protein [Candidatus Scalindua sp.]NOG83100.1 sodium:solute symporter family protein [Planctomycetota bacterium]RZV75880.1 MAG: sodium:solute symporter family protein [Candidatus Scalindua sp. SCAELEC01]TDE64938.1 MAG: sodium:solute symporter family protein [Candidatus Scalindua sp. AMX11]GJQ60212.1 MAG: sodium:solute symporter [Candidatus Scalindua sp.]